MYENFGEMIKVNLSIPLLPNAPIIAPVIAAKLSEISLPDFLQFKDSSFSQ